MRMASPREVPVEADAERAGEAAREPALTLVRVGRDDERPALHGAIDRGLQHVDAALARRPEAQIGHPATLLPGPVDRLRQRPGARRQHVVKDACDVDPRARRLLLDGRRDGGPVAEPVHEVAVRGPVGGERDPVREQAEVRVARMDPAVDDRDRDPPARPAAQRRRVQSNRVRRTHPRSVANRARNGPGRSSRSAGRPSCAMRPSRITTARSARRASSGRCVMSTVVRPRISAA